MSRNDPVVYSYISYFVIVWGRSSLIRVWAHAKNGRGEAEMVQEGWGWRRGGDIGHFQIPTTMVVTGRMRLSQYDWHLASHLSQRVPSFLEGKLELMPVSHLPYSAIHLRIIQPIAVQGAQNLEIESSARLKRTTLCRRTRILPMGFTISTR